MANDVCCASGIGRRTTPGAIGGIVGLSSAFLTAGRRHINQISTWFADIPESMEFEDLPPSMPRRPGARSVPCQVVSNRQGLGGRYATIDGDLLLVGNEPSACGDAWLLEGAIVSVSGAVVSITPTGVSPLLLRLASPEAAEEWAKDLHAAMGRSTRTANLAEQVLLERRKRREDYLKKCQGRKALEEAERRIYDGAAVCVQGCVVSITGLPEPPLLLRFENELTAEDWAEQLGLLLKLPISSKERESTCPTPRSRQGRFSGGDSACGTPRSRNGLGSRRSSPSPSPRRERDRPKPSDDSFLTANFAGA